MLLRIALNAHFQLQATVNCCATPSSQNHFRHALCFAWTEWWISSKTLNDCVYFRFFRLWFSMWVEWFFYVTFIGLNIVSTLIILCFIHKSHSLILYTKKQWQQHWFKLHYALSSAYLIKPYLFSGSMDNFWHSMNNICFLFTFLVDFVAMAYLLYFSLKKKYIAISYCCCRCCLYWWWKILSHPFSTLSKYR